MLELKYESELCQEVDCTEEENKKFSEMLAHKEELPTDVIQRQTSYGAKLDEFYRVIPLPLSSEDLLQYCALKNMKNIKTIKNCVVFFTVIAILSLTVSLFLLLAQS